MALAGCDAFAPGPRPFVIHIDSVQAPIAQSQYADLQLFFHGPIGPNGCYRFLAFTVRRTFAVADVTVVGESSSGQCTQATVYLHGEPLMITPPFTDTFTVRVHQPDGAVLTKRIPIE